MRREGGVLGRMSVLCGMWKEGGKAHLKYSDSFRLAVAGSSDENDWRTRSSMGRESHAFLSSMHPSFLFVQGKYGYYHG